MSASMQQLPRPEQLIDVAGHMAAVKLAMDGQFDARIAELKVAIAALDEKTSIAQTLDQAQKVKDDADAYAVAALAKAKEALSKAQDATDKVASRESIVTARESVVASRESAADARQATQDAREQSILGAQNSRDASLTARETAVKKGEIELAGKVKKLSGDQAAFNQKLDALKV